MILEASPYLNPNFLLTAFILAGGLIAWFVRLESKAISIKEENARICKEFTERCEKLEHTHKDLQTNFLAHVMNVNAHYNEQAMTEFKNSLDRRFLSMETSLKEIKVAIERKL